jgi:hypothetical protein
MLDALKPAVQVTIPRANVVHREMRVASDRAPERFLALVVVHADGFLREHKGGDDIADDNCRQREESAQKSRPPQRLNADAEVVSEPGANA